MIQFSCQNCNHLLNVSDKYAGRKGKCPSCGSIVQVPALQKEYSKKDIKIKFLCSQCHQKIGALEEWVGRKVKCAKCGSVNIVPYPEKMSASKASEENIRESGILSSESRSASEDFGAEDAMENLLQLERSGSDIEKPGLVQPVSQTAFVNQQSTIYGVTSKLENENLYREAGHKNNFFLQIFCSLIGALIGAGIWAAIAAFTGFELGIVAIGVGALAGWGITLFSEDRTNMLGVMAAVFAIVGILAGKALVAKYVVIPKAGEFMREFGAQMSQSGEEMAQQVDKQQINEILNDYESMFAMTLVYLMDNGEFDRELVKEYHFARVRGDMPEHLKQDAEIIDARVNECLEKWDDNQKEQIVRQSLPGFFEEFVIGAFENPQIIDNLFYEAFIATFSWFDLLWFPLAMATAFKIGSGQS